MKYDSLYHPLQWNLNNWSANKTNDLQESQAKAIPCHVVQVEKDFVHVAFETVNNIFTMPVVKMTQGFSRFGREPTQVGDKGYAVPNDYYMGGQTAYSGGKTSFYPRANLSSLSFQPVANLNAPTRDYDQHHETGGPNGWIVRTMEPQQVGQGPGQSPVQDTGTGGSGTAPALSRAQLRVMQQRHFAHVSKFSRATRAAIPTPRDVTGTTPATGSSSNGSSQQQNNDQTQFQFDKNGLCTIQSKDTKHLITVDQQNQKITIQIPKGEYIYVGGDGKEGKYSDLVTVDGPVINAKGRIE